MKPRTNKRSVQKMKTNSWFIAGLFVLSAVGTGFLYWFRVETDARVGQSVPLSSEAPNHARFDEVLQARVNAEGQVDYGGLKASPEKLETYLDRLASADLAALSYYEQLAFWLNAYNALVIKGVVDRYPTTSVRSVKPFGGFFYRLKFQVAGKPYTLNEIEHDVIRAEFVDARVHFALVCASAGCPTLENRAFFANTLEERLETATFNFVANPEKVRLERSERRLYLSKIFKWYAADFTEGYAGVTDFLADYLPPDDAEFLETEEVELHYLDYDWTLNDQR